MTDLFCRFTDTLSTVEVGKMMINYGFIGYAYYCATIIELYKNNGKLGLADLEPSAKRIGIETKKLKHFVNDCINKYNIFKSDGENFWQDDFLKHFVKDKKQGKGGRPKKDIVKDRVDLTDIEFVNLEKNDFTKLQIKFGEKLTLSAIQILDNWLAKKGTTAKQYLGKNHYGFFRKDGWVMNEAKTTEE